MYENKRRINVVFCCCLADVKPYVLCLNRFCLSTIESNQVEKPTLTPLIEILPMLPIKYVQHNDLWMFDGKIFLELNCFLFFRCKNCKKKVFIIYVS
jgi:hypothetical protein